KRDWSSDVCSSDLGSDVVGGGHRARSPEGGRRAEGRRHPRVTAASTRTYVRPRMGTLLAATLPVGESDVHARHVATIFETAGVCEDVMSRHRPDAGVSRLNARAGDPEGIVSAEL